MTTNPERQAVADPMNDDLVGRLEAAEAGSREMDALIWLAVNPGGEIDLKETGRTCVEAWRCRLPGSIRASWSAPPPVTTSLDAALALAERLYPGSGVLVADYRGLANMALWNGKYQYTKGWCSLSLDDDAMSNFRTYAHTPALAVCAAILKARPSAGTGSHEGEG